MYYLFTCFVRSRAKFIFKTMEVHLYNSTRTTYNGVVKTYNRHTKTSKWDSMYILVLFVSQLISDIILGRELSTDGHRWWFCSGFSLLLFAVSTFLSLFLFWGCTWGWERIFAKHIRREGIPAMYRNYSDLNKEKMRQAQAQLQTSRGHIPGYRSNLDYNRMAPIWSLVWQPPSGSPIQ